MKDEPYIWDRSHKWIVQRTHRSECKIWAIIEELQVWKSLLNVRRVFTNLRETPPAEIKRHIDDGRIFLGTDTSIEFQKIKPAAQFYRLPLDVVPLSATSYLPIDTTTNAVLLIEGNDEARRIGLEMIAAGAQVQDVEVD